MAFTSTPAAPGKATVMAMARTGEQSGQNGKGGKGLAAAIGDFLSATSYQDLAEAIDEETIQIIAANLKADGGHGIFGLLATVEKELLTTGSQPQQIIDRIRTKAGKSASQDEARDLAEFARSTALQREFGSASTYAAYMRAHRDGQVTIAGTRAKRPTSRRAAPAASTATDDDADRALFANRQNLQAEFGSVEAYLAYRRAERGGQVSIYQRGRAGRR